MESKSHSTHSNINDGLKKLGYDDDILKNITEPIPKEFSIARVVSVNKNSYMVSDGMHEMFAELSGKFLFNADSITDHPTVGDWVSIQILDNFSLAIVHSVLPRKTLLKRKEPGKNIDYQLIASNLDFGLVVQSADNFNSNLLERYFVMLNESQIQPLIAITKTDLLSSSEINSLKSSLSKLKEPFLLVNNKAEKGADELLKKLIPGKTYCLLGKSGVGKTTLLNKLLQKPILKVNEVRQKDGKGRHTTVKRQLLCINTGSIFIDTPGMRELGNFNIAQGLEQTFDEFSFYGAQCRYKNCSHRQEKGCAVIAAVQKGEIEESRYRNFIKLKKESEFYEMSYQEKRKKDKSFGKMLKNYQKLKKKK